jgi:fatty acid desaturase
MYDKELYEKSDLLGFLFLSRNIILYFTFIFVGVYFNSLYVWIPIWLFCALLLTSLSVLLHDCSHQTFFKTKFMNSLFGRIGGIINFELFSFYRDWHFQHHRKTGTKEDSEEEFEFNGKISFVLTSLFYFRFYQVLPLYHTHVKKNKYTLSSLRKKEYLFDSILIILWIIIFIGLLYYFPKQTLFFYIIPYLFSNPLNFILDLSEHYKTRKGEKEYYLNTRTILTHPLISSLLFHINYHVEHHKQAGIPFHKIVKFHRSLDKKNYQYLQKGYLNFWLKSWRTL